jgi:hypothetical protein
MGPVLLKPRKVSCFGVNTFDDHTPAGLRKRNRNVMATRAVAGGRGSALGSVKRSKEASQITRSSFVGEGAPSPTFTNITFRLVAAGQQTAAVAITWASHWVVAGRGKQRKTLTGVADWVGGSGQLLAWASLGGRGSVEPSRCGSPSWSVQWFTFSRSSQHPGKQAVPIR